MEEMRSGVTAGMAPAGLSDKQALRLHQLLHDAKFADPRGDHLSPAGDAGTICGRFRPYMF